MERQIVFVTALRRRCVPPRYRSVVFTETCRRRNLISSLAGGGVTQPRARAAAIVGRQPAASSQRATADFTQSWISSEKFELNSDIPVTRQTPPTFLLQAENDPVDNVNNSLVYDIALKNAGVPVERGGSVWPHKFPETAPRSGLRRIARQHDDHAREDDRSKSAPHAHSVHPTFDLSGS